MKNFIRSLLLVACSLLMTGRTLIAQQPGNNGEVNEFKGVFKGISTGKMRQQGAKRPISLWTMDGEGGEKLSIPILAPDASIQKVIASPKNYIGKRCIVAYDQGEETLVGFREPVDLNHVISVRWSDTAGSPAEAVGKASITSGGSPEEVVRSFFAAVENKDLATLTELLNDPVSYYQPKPAPRAAALADIKSDWRKYSNWKGEVSKVEVQNPNACTFQLSYSLLEGSKPKSATLQCSVTLNPSAPGRISSISA
jgi:hypothetical protein